MTGDRTKRAPPSRDTPPARSGLTLSVRDFGPIAEGEVDLRPLTVFAGPSNTGKSWLATLVYALERYLVGPYSGTRMLAGNLLDRGLKREEIARLIAQFPDDPFSWEKCVKKGTPIVFSAGEKQRLETFLGFRHEGIEQEILRCFGLSNLSFFVREGKATETSVIATISETEFLPSIRHRLSLSTAGDNDLEVEILSDPLSLPTVIQYSEMFQSWARGLSTTDVFDTDEEKAKKFLSFAVLETIQSALVRRSNRSTFFLPADRGGIMHAHSVVVRTLIQSASRAGLSSTPSLPALSGVVADFLERLVGMATDIPEEHGGDSSRFLQSDRVEFSERMEKAILRGDVHVDRSEVSYPRFAFQPAGWERSLPLMNASSMVTELAPVVLFLRHLVRPSDLLILEEPEAHLHPAMQVKFVREIATCVKNGIRVLLTTHSEWVLEELANIVARSESGAKGAALPKEQVGLWLFDHKKPGGSASGSTIREIEWNPDEGGFDAQYDKVAMALHNDWATLVDGAA